MVFLFLRTETCKSARLQLLPASAFMLGPVGLLPRGNNGETIRSRPFFQRDKNRVSLFLANKKNQEDDLFFFLFFFFLSPLCSRPVYSSATQTWCVLYKWIMYTTGCHIVQKWSRLANEAWNSLLDTEAKLAAPVNVGSVFF